MSSPEMGSERKRMTSEDARSIEAAYTRGHESAMEELGDGPLLLRKSPLTVADHDKLEAELQKWLAADTNGYRAPGVMDNLFKLSGYISGELDVPDESTLLFLHAYIFALEHRTFYDKEELKRLRNTPEHRLRRLLGPPHLKRRSHERTDK